MSPETKKEKKLQRLHLKIEEGESVESKEFLESLQDLLRSNGLDPEQLVFSGMNGAPFKKNRKPVPVKGIYAMNMAGWELTFNDPIHLNSPAVYAERYEARGVPAIGLFDKNQLVEAYSHKPEEHEPNLKEVEEELGRLSLGGQTVHTWQEEDDEGLVPIKNDVLEGEFDNQFSYTTTPGFVESPHDFEDVELGDHLAEMPNHQPVLEGVVHTNYPDISPIEALVGIVYIEKVPIKYSGPRSRAGF